MSGFTDLFVVREPHDTEESERFIRLMRMVHKMLRYTFFEDDEIMEYMRSEIFNNREDEYIDEELMVTLVETAATVEEYEYPLVDDSTSESKIVDSYLENLGGIAATFLQREGEADVEKPKIIFH